MTATADVSHSPEPAVGAYGFRFTGLARGADVGLLSLDPESSWPPVHVSWARRTGPRPLSRLDDDEAVILLVEEEYVEVHRRTPAIAFQTMCDLDEHDLVHPYLAAPSAVMAEWHGRVALHAGAVHINGGAWAVLGEKAAGKTTILAACRARGYEVVTDDLLVVQGTSVFAGPRSLDLRPPTAERLAADEHLIEVRGGERSRLTLRPIRPELPLMGILVLAPGKTIEFEPIPVVERLTLLRGHGLLGRRGQESVLDVLVLPTWRLRYPRQWEALDETVDAILDATDTAMPAGQGGG